MWSCQSVKIQTVKPKKRRKFKGFAALDRRGNLLWGTMATKEGRAQELFKNFNPEVDGHPNGEKIVQVEIYIKT